MSDLEWIRTIFVLGFDYGDRAYGDMTPDEAWREASQNACIQNWLHRPRRIGSAHDVEDRNSSNTDANNRDHIATHGQAENTTQRRQDHPESTTASTASKMRQKSADIASPQR